MTINNDIIAILSKSDVYNMIVTIGYTSKFCDECDYARRFHYTWGSGMTTPPNEYIKRRRV